ncbi:hypothetical protein NTE_01074 [Candidatus Nitrososphaera evergladensis SR1]|uniref:Uncharacterized protein n=1 Tax=Candidatus Nitrososphaera evergladensis SR1 TaxID=1459636 RepID=A0A075MQK1_9ARCH|nr:hypothetical protein [Candidatus Nitrososphaera evergladensis]AIF83147.1 hypothetical protein NTE_01074 [Candidatus Nitrososphaera evergladensis SR1]
MSGKEEKQQGFFKRYREAIKFNRNIVIAGLGAFFTGALVAQLYSSFDKSGNNLANSAFTLASEYAVYIPAFAFLYYWDNRYKYVDPSTGRRDSKKLRADVKKLLATFSVSEVAFSLTKVGVQFQLLQSSNDAYISAMAASIVAWAVFFVLVNYMARLVRLFRNSS